MTAWLFQAHRAKKALGDKAPWSVAWYARDGKKKSKKIGCKSLAEKFARKVEGKLANGKDAHENKFTWAEFRKDYEAKILSATSPGNREVSTVALEQFERLIKPVRMESITTATIDSFITKRRTERGRRPKSTISPATVNSNLRSLRAALHVAHEWDMLRIVPKFRFLKENWKLPTYIEPELFADIYKACEQAVDPSGLPYSAADWWKGVLVFAYMTGWRIGEILALRRAEVDLDKGTAITRAEDNKSSRDDRTPLHPVIVEHLRRLPGFTPLMFPWNGNNRQLYAEWHRLQKLAGVHLPCDGKHEHTEACYVYGFHALRRSFATLNAEHLTGDALQALMRHKDYGTTKRYIAVARQLNKAVAGLTVPAVLRGIG